MNILLLGGSGFVGSHLARRLSAAGHGVTIPTRRPVRARELSVNPMVNVVAADIHDDKQLARLMAGRDAVINLVGILRGDFQRVHVALPRRIALAARAAAVPRLLHMSALGAANDAPSHYLRSKAAGEAALRNVAEGAASGLAVTVFRPSVIFGDGDNFLNLFARLLRVAPVLPLACPDARFQPVWVEDVAAAFADSLCRSESHGRHYDLGGPHGYTLRQLVAYVGQVCGHPRPIIGLSPGLSYLQALLMECLPGGPMTRDNVASMKQDNLCPAGTVFPFGIAPTALEAVAPGYLGGVNRRQRLVSYCRRV
ncbi:MAG: complex I NDUFA9 subunit family protein [Rhodocyclaceae bacterium]|nr:MAG: complex I NDUFA9 subunit family protein [Rhodocyclaceae bacterium]